MAIVVAAMATVVAAMATVVAAMATVVAGKATGFARESAVQKIYPASHGRVAAHGGGVLIRSRWQGVYAAVLSSRKTGRGIGTAILSRWCGAGSPLR
jgi:hypothetical protein